MTVAENAKKIKSFISTAGAGQGRKDSTAIKLALNVDEQNENAERLRFWLTFASDVVASNPINVERHFGW